MKLNHIHQVTGKIELVSGLHIGAGNTEMHIGGTDNPVIKNPVTQQPYVPGSSLKGKMRSLMEWRAGVVGVTKGAPVSFKHLTELEQESLSQAETILKLFGGAPEGAGLDQNLVSRIGPSRLSFWDCELDTAWVESMKSRNELLTEIKMENSIDRIKGVAENPRNTERVPAGAIFDFRLSIRVHDEEDLIEDVLIGLRLLELSGIGGSGSRGYGKLKFEGLEYAGESLMERLSELTV